MEKNRIVHLPILTYTYPTLYFIYFILIVAEFLRTYAVPNVHKCVATMPQASW